MPDRSPLLSEITARIRGPFLLTWAGMIAERLTQAFWPLWTVLAGAAAFVFFGLHDDLPLGSAWIVLAALALALLVFAVQGVRAFQWPNKAAALARLDDTLPGRPLAALSDTQRIGAGDAGSESLWQAHQRRMAAQAEMAKAVEPDLQLSQRDPYGLRYIALLALVCSLMFGSLWRVQSLSELALGPSGLAAGEPTWEGWIEPPEYTGLPSLYLADQAAKIRIPAGSRITLRLYGEVGALSVSETVSGAQAGTSTDSEQAYEAVNNGKLQIDGPGGQIWVLEVIPDLPPFVEAVSDEMQTTFEGLMTLPFKAIDDYGIAKGRAIITLDLPRIDRAYGLEAEPEAREDVILDLPMPITGGRENFSENLVENLSEHPWAHLPVRITLEVTDGAGQVGESDVFLTPMPARRFFDPLASAMIEQRRDLLWSPENAKTISQLMRAVSYRPNDSLFRSTGSYLIQRMILRRLEALMQADALTPETRDELSDAFWDLALLLEDGDIGNALERMREAQERLSEAIKNGASPEEIARLMQELREATNDYLRQKSQQAQREGGGDQQLSENMMRMTQQDLQEMMDRIQELMEQGRFAEAQQALDEFQQMMENMRVTEGQGGEGDTPGEQAMEGLAETLKEQQGLSDQAFRDLQEQFNSGAQSGQSQGNQGFDGGLGQGQSHNQPGQGQGDGGGDQNGEGAQAGGRGDGGDSSLADRQQALREELQRQRGTLPGSGSEAGRAARDSLERAENAMRGAENALRDGNLAEAVDGQAQAMEALREGMRNLADSMDNQAQGGQGQASGRKGNQGRDPLGRASNGGGELGDGGEFFNDDAYGRARELVDEIRRKSGEGARPEAEREYFKRLLDRF
ncbi:hypothetical protein ROA7450_01985 [Roseovarius albus]|uniref:TIGR02302 family protein n=1 Tax=Roseovarius albus TaxID=1247867 RepID=A0A1X6Z5D6_9RHOB|nr:TIGR02302 family protein [Roseovarius albus]SLN41014.1 hypothetical protein ROA7450_01985 [Roseovarius albus]